MPADRAQVLSSLIDVLKKRVSQLLPPARGSYPPTQGDFPDIFDASVRHALERVLDPEGARLAAEAYSFHDPYLAISVIERALAGRSQAYRFLYDGREYDAFDVIGEREARLRALGRAISPVARDVQALEKQIAQARAAGQGVLARQLSQRRLTLMGLLKRLGAEARSIWAREEGPGGRLVYRDLLLRRAYEVVKANDEAFELLYATRRELTSLLQVYGFEDLEQGVSAYEARYGYLYGRSLVRSEPEIWHYPLSLQSALKQQGVVIAGWPEPGASLRGYLEDEAFNQIYGIPREASPADIARARALNLMGAETGAAAVSRRVPQEKISEVLGRPFAEEYYQAVAKMRAGLRRPLEPGAFVAVGGRAYQVTGVGETVRLRPIVPEISSLGLRYRFRLRPGEQPSGISRAYREFSRVAGLSEAQARDVLEALDEAVQEAVAAKVEEQVVSGPVLTDKKVRVARFAHQEAALRTVQEVLDDLLRDRSVSILSQNARLAIEASEELASIYREMPLVAEIIAKHFPQSVRVASIYGYDDLWDLAQSVSEQLVREASMLELSGTVTYQQLAEILEARVKAREGEVWARFFGARGAGEGLVADIASFQRYWSEVRGERLADFETFRSFIKSASLQKRAPELFKRLSRLDDEGLLRAAFLEEQRLYGAVERPLSYDVVAQAIESVEEELERAGSDEVTPVSGREELSYRVGEALSREDLGRLASPERSYPALGALDIHAVASSLDLSSPEAYAASLLRRSSEIAGDLAVDVEEVARGLLARIEELDLISPRFAGAVREQLTAARARGARRIAAAGLPPNVSPIEEGGRIVGFDIAVRDIDQLRGVLRLEEALKAEGGRRFERAMTAGGVEAEFGPNWVQVGAKRIYLDQGEIQISLAAAKRLSRIDKAQALEMSTLARPAPVGEEIPVYRRLPFEARRVRWLGYEAEPFIRQVLALSRPGVVESAAASVLDIETWRTLGEPGFTLTEISYTRPASLTAAPEVVTRYVRPTRTMERQVRRLLDKLAAGTIAQNEATALRHIMKYSGLADWETAQLTAERVEAGMRFLRQHGVPRAAAIRQAVRDLAEAQLIIGYNIRAFDIPALEWLSRRLKTPFEVGRRGIVDVYALIYATEPVLESYKLTDVARAKGIAIQGAHFASQDILIGRKVAQDILIGRKAAQAIEAGADLAPMRVGETLLAIRPRLDQGVLRHDYYSISGWETAGERARVELRNVVTGEVVAYSGSYGEVTGWLHETFVPEEVNWEFQERVVRDRARRNYYRSLEKNPLDLTAPGRRIGARRMLELATGAAVDPSLPPGERAQLAYMRERALQERPLIEPMLDRLQELWRRGLINEREARQVMRAFLRDINLRAPARTRFLLHPVEQKVEVAGARFSTFSPELAARDIGAYLKRNYHRYIGGRGRPSEQTVRLARGMALWDLAEEFHRAGFFTEQEIEEIRRLSPDAHTAVKDRIVRKLLAHGEAMRRGMPGGFIESAVEADVFEPRPQDLVDRLLEKREGRESALEALIRQHTARFEKRARLVEQAAAQEAAAAAKEAEEAVSSVGDLVASIRAAFSEEALSEESRARLSAVLEVYGVPAGQLESLPEQRVRALADELSRAIGAEAPGPGPAQRALARSITERPALMRLGGRIASLAAPFLIPLAVGGTLYLAGTFLSNSPLSVDEMPQPDQAPAPDRKFTRRAPAPVRQTAPRSYVSPEGTGYSGVALRVRARGRGLYTNPEEVQAALAAAVNQAVPFKVDINTNLYDNLNEIDEQWLDERIAEVLAG